MTEKFKLRNKSQNIGLVIGVAVFIIMLFMSPPEGLSLIGYRVLTASVLMIIFWMTNAIDIAATALLPILLFPLLGITGSKVQNDIDLFGRYAYPTVFLILGVGFLASAMTRWGLHKRIAYGITMKVGKNLKLLILGVIISVAFVSMWMSNTTAAVMMLPIALSIINSLSDQIEDGFKKALLLAIPFASSMGGLATIIGTTTNPTGVGIISETIGVELDFLSWLKIGLPFTLVMIPVTWIYLVKFFKLDNMKSIEIDTVKQAYDELGPMNKGEKLTAIIFLISVMLWVTRTFWQGYVPFATDETIAIGIAIACLIVPVDLKSGTMVLQGKEAFKEAPWTTLILIGGSMSMGNAITKSGVAAWIANLMSGLNGMSPLIIIIIVGIVTAIATEVATNAVVVAAFLPVLAGVAEGVGMDPLQLMLTCMIASNFAFMLPAGTPPNAIVFSAGVLDVKDMMKAGIGLKIIGLIIFPIIMYFITFGLLGVGA